MRLLACGSYAAACNWTFACGGASAEGEVHGQAHHGIMVGLADAPEVRDRIMAKVRQFQSAGLGDERRATGVSGKTASFSDGDVDLLTEIRDQIVRLRTHESNPE
ncbi:hypothetical protein ACFL2H_12990 [Planctomycetota bacterium]